MNRKWKKNTAAKMIIFSATILIFLATFKGDVKAKYIMTYLYGQGDYLSMIEETGNALDEVSPSYFDITKDGNLNLNYIDAYLINELHSKGIKVVPFLSNHWDRELRKKGAC